MHSSSQKTLLVRISSSDVAPRSGAVFGCCALGETALGGTGAGCAKAPMEARHSESEEIRSRDHIGGSNRSRAKKRVRLQRAGEGARARGEEGNKPRDISANPEGSGAQCVAVTNRLTAVRRMRRLFAEDLGEAGNHRRLPANSIISNYFHRE